jgi:starch synthase
MGNLTSDMSDARPRRLKVLSISSEVAPFAKTGGLGDVCGVFPRFMPDENVDIRLLLPRYWSIDRKELEDLGLPLCVRLGPEEAWCGLFGATLPGSKVPVYFLDYERFYGRAEIYGPHGGEYFDNCQRFALLSQAAFEVCWALGWQPDILHCHDWHSALIPLYLNSTRRHGWFGNTASVLSIHNMGYQGRFAKHNYWSLGTSWSHFNFLELEYRDDINLLKGGLYHANLLTTVSPTYAWEIQTPEGGFGLEGVVRNRHDALCGILNGMDYDEWNPAADPLLPAAFDVDDLAGKAVCKAQLQREAGLPVLRRTPVYAVISRLASQKGLDLLQGCLERLLTDQHLQFVVLGVGDAGLEGFFRSMMTRYPKALAFWNQLDFRLAHLIEAGADFFVMPSHYEPCGTSQMISMRYGTLPIVRGVGGLNDTVANYEPEAGTGTGFKFAAATPAALHDTIAWSAWEYHNRPRPLLALRRRAMRMRFSWTEAARQYRWVYDEALRRKRGLPDPQAPFPG